LRGQNIAEDNKFKLDGFVKSPSAALCFIPALLNEGHPSLKVLDGKVSWKHAQQMGQLFNRVNHCDPPQADLIPQDSHALHMNFLLCRRFNDFLRSHQAYVKMKRVKS
jgi:hypothetical protein